MPRATDNNGFLVLHCTVKSDVFTYIHSVVDSVDIRRKKIMMEFREPYLNLHKIETRLQNEGRNLFELYYQVRIKRAMETYRSVAQIWCARTK